MTERIDSTFDVEGESAWELSERLEPIREQWAADVQKTARENADYGELFRRALIVQTKLRWCAAELEELSIKAACLRDGEIGANLELVPDELADCYRADFRAEACEDCHTVFPGETWADLKSLSDDLGDMFSTETFDSLQYLADLWETHWARHHDVNESVKK
jgi:hypothetical protein